MPESSLRPKLPLLLLYTHLSVALLFTVSLILKVCLKAIATSCCTTGTVMVILACATGFSKILTVEQVPQLVTQTLLEISDSKIVLLILINIMLLIVGCFMDQTPAILILSPILLPVATSLGLDPVHFGLIMVANLAIGFITPPLGMALFVAARISNTKLEVVLKGNYSVYFPDYRYSNLDYFHSADHYVPAEFNEVTDS